jgi:hypothetical protein
VFDANADFAERGVELDLAGGEIVSIHGPVELRSDALLRQHCEEVKFALGTPTVVCFWPQLCSVVRTASPSKGRRQSFSRRS